MKSKARTVLSHSIILASKSEHSRHQSPVSIPNANPLTVGGPDPALNSSLAIAINNAKRNQLSKDTIQAAILKGQGKSLSGLPLESVVIEAILPHGVAAIIECESDNKARTLQDIRLIVHKAGGTITPTAFLFERKGRIQFEEQDKVGVDDALEEAIEAGAMDLVSEDGRLVVETAPSEVSAVAERLSQSLNLSVDKAEIVYVPNEDSLVSLTEEQEGDLHRILESLENDNSFQNLYINAAGQ